MHHAVEQQHRHLRAVLHAGERARASSCAQRHPLHPEQTELQDAVIPDRIQDGRGSGEGRILQPELELVLDLRHIVPLLCRHHCPRAGPDGRLRVSIQLLLDGEHRMAGGMLEPNPLHDLQAVLDPLQPPERFQRGQALRIIQIAVADVKRPIEGNGHLLVGRIVLHQAVDPAGGLVQVPAHERAVAAERQPAIADQPVIRL